MPKREPISAKKSPILEITVVLMVFLFTAGVGGECPTLCECKWKNGKESVQCLSANLTAIPSKLDAGTQVLDLQRNELLRIDRDEFSNVNLVNLQRLYLINCQLAYLDKFAFRNLINLVELDLSENCIQSVPSHTFDSISELRELKLSSNPILRLESMAFGPLVRLVRLELSNCNISKIDVRAFDGPKSTLEWLKLDGNKLINIKPNSLTTLSNLHGIELTGNDWNCTCALRPLREWLMKKNVPLQVSPMCKYPSQLSGKLWSRLDIDEFACPPQITPLSRNVKVIDGQNVTISCSITAGNPDPHMRWLFRNRVIIGNVTQGRMVSSGGVGVGVGVGSSGSSSVAAITTKDQRRKYGHQQSKKHSNLTVFGIDSHDSGSYKCIAENEAGKSEATISVVVYSKQFLIDDNNNVIEATLSLTYNNNKFILIISTVVAILFVIFSFLLAICFYTIKNANLASANRHHGNQNRKKLKGLNLLCQQGSESYEKIEMMTGISTKQRKPDDDDVVNKSQTAFGPNTNSSRRKESLSIRNFQNSPTLSINPKRNGEYSTVPTSEEDLGGFHIYPATRSNDISNNINNSNNLSSWKLSSHQKSAFSFQKQLHSRDEDGVEVGEGAEELSKRSTQQSNTSSLSSKECGGGDEPLIRISSNCDNSSSSHLKSSRTPKLKQHILKKQILAPPPLGSSSSAALDPSAENIVIYSSSNNSELDEDKQMLDESNLSPKLNSIIRNDENFDFFGASDSETSNLDGFYAIKKLNYDPGKHIPSPNYYYSLPRKKWYESKIEGKSLTGFGSDLMMTEEQEEENNLMTRTRSNSDLNLMMSSEGSNQLKYPKMDNELIIKSLLNEARSISRNVATPLLNIPNPVLAPSSGVFPSSSSSAIMTSPLPPSPSCNAPLNASSMLSPSSTSSAVVNTGNDPVPGGDYDYHAAQLELFLVEYKKLQHQLCKMKETCDTIRRTETLYSSNKNSSSLKANPNFSSSSSSSSTPSTIPFDQINFSRNTNILLANEPAPKSLPKSLPLNKHKSFRSEESNIIGMNSGGSGGMSLAGGGGGGGLGAVYRQPEPPPYWLHRNEMLKEIQAKNQSHYLSGTPQKNDSTSPSSSTTSSSVHKTEDRKNTN